MLPPIHRWDAVPGPRAAVHIVHGMAEHGARYARFARALNAAGIVAWAHDHRGHGINPVPGIRGHFADSDGWPTVVQDVRDVSNRDGARVPRRAVRALRALHGLVHGPGHPARLGSHVRRRRARGDERSARRAGGCRARARARPALGARTSCAGDVAEEDRFWSVQRPVRPTRTEADWLSRDPAEVDAYIRNPLCNFAITAQTWEDFLGGKADLASAARVARIPKAVPILVIAGTRNPSVTTPGASSGCCARTRPLD